MARRRHKNRPEPSLFPFLSILACVIGALALLITTQAVGQIADESVDVDRYEALEEGIERDRREVQGLQTLATEVETLSAELAAARAQEALAQQSRSDPQATPLRERLQAAGSRHSALKRELEQLAEGARKRASELDAQRGRPEAAVRVRPSGSGHGLLPQFIECRRDGLRLYTAAGPVNVPAHGISTSAAFRNFVRGVAQRENATVIFLIRPGGVPLRDIALKSIREVRVRTAEIPVPGDGPLDLSAFESVPGVS